MPKRLTMFLIAIAILFATPVFATAAAASDPTLVLVHHVESFLVDGSSDYSILSPKFASVFASVTGGSPVGNGSVRFRNASYTYGVRGELLEGAGTRVSAQDSSFTLKYSSEEEAFCVYKSSSESGNVLFWGDAELGMSQKSFDFTVNSTSVQGTTPKIRSLSDQIGSYIPYISLALEEGRIARIDWRFVNVTNPGVALRKDNTATIRSLRRIRLNLDRGETRTINIDRTFAAGETLEGSQYLDTGVEFSPLSSIEIDFIDESNTGGERAAARQVWTFHPLELLVKHTSNAAIYNGLTDYTHTTPAFKLAELVMSSGAVTLKDTIGSLILRDGSFAYGPRSTFDSGGAGTLVNNADTSMKLSYDRSSEMLLPGDSAGDPFCFWGAADSGLSGRAFTYYLGGMTASGSLPPTKSTGDQLSGGVVPYVSYVTDGDYVTKIRWRFVNPLFPTEALVKGTGIAVNWLQYVRVESKNGSRIYEINVDKKLYQGEVMEGTVDLPESIRASEMGTVSVFYYDSGYRAGSNSAVQYSWAFEEKGSDSTGGGGGGGGCSSTSNGLFFALMLALISFILMGKRCGDRAPR